MLLERAKSPLTVIASLRTTFVAVTSLLSLRNFSVGDCPIPHPFTVTLTVLPTVPSAGVTELNVGFTVKFKLLLASPSRVTTTGPLDASQGTVKVTCVSLTLPTCARAPFTVTTTAAADVPNR